VRKVIAIELFEQNESHWVSYFSGLEKCSAYSYQDNFDKDMVFDARLDDLDCVYCYIRKLVVENLPMEERGVARNFGVAILRPFSVPEVRKSILDRGGVSVEDVLYLNNRNIHNTEVNIA
jgi:hypothetical protein